MFLIFEHFLFIAMSFSLNFVFQVTENCSIMDCIAHYFHSLNKYSFYHLLFLRKIFSSNFFHFVTNVFFNLFGHILYFKWLELLNISHLSNKGFLIFYSLIFFNHLNWYSHLIILHFLHLSSVCNYRREIC